MDAEFSGLYALTADERRELYARRDGPGLRRFGAQLFLLFVSGALTVGLAARGDNLFWLAFAAYSVLLAAMFAAMHEAGHGTAFRSRGLNRLVLRIAAALMLMPPTGFCAFHFEHHRKTHVPGDPELPSGDIAFAAWPKNPLVLLILLSGQLVLLGKIATLVNAAVGRGPAWWDRWVPFIAPAQRPAVTAEARLILLAWLALAALAWLWFPPLAWLLAGLSGAHLVLGPYITAEHTGLPTGGDVLARSRSIRTNALVRWLFWNMPYHAEHHGWPALPFHALPALHRRVADRLPVRVRGYLHVYADFVLRRLAARA
ncbi:MAG TPA: fatty acid desaturase [Nannocystis sp.]